MTTVLPQRTAAPVVFSAHLPARRHNLVLRAALLGLFAAPMLPALAQTAAINAGTAAQEPAKLPVFPEIVVNAKQDYERRAGTKTVVTADDLERRNVTEMGGIVRYLPLISAPAAASGSGSVWDGSGNTGYNIRGLEGNRVSLELDGISLPDAAPKPDGNTLNAFATGRDYFDPETFREVRIDSGTTAASGANPGLGGGVAFITKSPEDYLGEGQDHYVAYKYGRATADRSNAHTLTGAAKIGANLQGLAVYVHRDGEQMDSRGTTPVNPDDWHSNALLSKLVWTLPGEQKLDLTVDMFERKNKRDLRSKVSTYYPTGVQQDSTTKRTRVSLGHDVVLKDFALFDRLTSKVYLQNAKTEDKTQGLYTFGSPARRAIDTNFKNDSIGLTSEAFKQLNADNALLYGVQLEQLKTRRPWREDRVIVATGQHQVTNKNRMADMDTSKLALYVRDDLSFNLAGKKAVLTPGLRADYRKNEPKNLQTYAIAVPNAAKEVRKESDTYFTPSLSLSVEVLPQMNAYATFTRGTRLPTAAERTGTYDSFSYTGTGQGYAVLGNANLRKETSKAYELGLKGDVIRGLSMHASVYQTEYTDMIDYVMQKDDPVNYPTITRGLFRPENIGNARTWGAELTLRAELGAWAPAMQGYHVDLATGVAKGRSFNTQTGESGGLNSVAPAKSALTFGYDHANQLFGLALTAVHAGAKQAPENLLIGDAGPLFTVPSYTIFDLSTYWNVHKNAKIVVGVYNLTDRKYWDYAASRSLAAGTTAASRAEIERYAKPGRNVAASLSVNF
ncbi:putative hemoglobin and hemoglobin-haptoglobin-binding protein 2 precursor [Janthinobacterium sp. HH103]|uniref:TonB-dependent hemoglobin/transferrin/lactoferrin family receptor n=1 Tax=unclassified Janthinobacterium TaxID=2610881 RepID=UPI00087490D1|nr:MULTISPECIES: TonB-dependent hemoglobin/transferrin/lactoferrin family receptor [unclassified Janthinobacterium]OEZ72733.1 putative hemoglobin and hemoglobin-haptoglobin-binding protein 2 precursor [Janthinobacterium sp. HH100]OEZ86767.1 putative hemoglobin and hemoglobin-haptoglobin-binding protein 2 precursor [Janthinobacterium sp. HH103]QOU73873.1 Vitamin B12 transporter BtuB [Janthinobacterium sp. HH102]